MMRKIQARDYIESPILTEIRLNEVFESAIKAVLHPPVEEKKKKFAFFSKSKNKNKG